jgi:hypothetical protein
MRARALAGFALAAAVALVAVALVGRAGAAGASQLLVTFQINGTFKVTLPDGTPIGAPSPPGTTIQPGTYELVFDNSQNVKNLDFQIIGPNVSLQENMGGGEETAMSDYVTFVGSSQYRYSDGNNINSPVSYLQTSAGTGSTGANGSGLPGSNDQTSGTGSSNPTVVGSNNGSSSGLLTGSTSASIPLRGTLTGTVGATGALTLKFDGKPITSVEQGRYTVTISDHSSKNGFTIQHANQDPTTVSTVPFVGKRSANLTLRPGQWLYYPTFVGKKTYFLVTS